MTLNVFASAPETESRLKETARAEGLSVGQYVEGIVAESSLRRTQLTRFRAAIAERMASLEAGEIYDGEEAMARLMSDLPVR